MTTIFGWDASHYDAVPDGGLVVAEGVKFMTHKAGGDAVDAELGAWWSEMKPHRGKVLLGAYWVLLPGSPATRADQFVNQLDLHCSGWSDGPFILQVDCEEWNSDPSTVPSKADVKAFCDRLVFRAPKLRPIVYAPEWVYGGKLTGLGYPLWASHYVNGSGSASALYPGDSSSKWDAYSGQVPAILQFTSSATIAGQTTCDANAYRGTLAELTALLAPGWMEVPDVDLNDKIGDKAFPNRTVGDVLRDLAKLRGVLFGSGPDIKNAAFPPGSPLMQALGVAAEVEELKGQLAELEAKIGAVASPTIPQEQLDLAVLNALKTLAGGQA